MAITYQEALAQYGSRYRVRQAVAEGKLCRLERNLYSIGAGESPDTLTTACKLHPDAVVTGLTALYLHGLIDTPPELVDLATKRGGTKFSDNGISQHFVPESILAIGRSQIEHDGGTVPVYDLERMLLELVKMRNKIPYDLYREAVQSFRKRADDLDIYKLQDYAEAMPRGAAYLETAMREVF